MEASFMNGFTDIHTHILPGVDDGAAGMPQALELVRMAWKNGTRTLFLTPHYRGKFKESPQWLRESFSMFSQMVREELPAMKLVLGSEVHYEADMPERIQQKQVLSINDSQYLLLEFRGSSLRSQIIAGVSEVIRCGFIPIIAHVERYQEFLTDDSLVPEVLEKGALVQLNADSVMGQNGLRVKKFCHRMLKEQMVHFIASDAHDTRKRPPLLRDCFLRVHKKYGEEYAAQVFYHNAQAVIENQVIY